MNNLLNEAKLIIATNRTEKAHRDFMTTEQRTAIAEDYASQKHFLSAAHFTPDADKRIEFEELFQEYMRPKNN
jgi:hypothetical protein